MSSLFLFVLSHCLFTCTFALWSTDNFAMDFGGDGSYGAYNCGTSSYYNFQYNFTFEAWIKHRWPSNAPIGSASDFSGISNVIIELGTIIYC